MASKHKWLSLNGTLNEDRLQGAATQLSLGTNWTAILRDISWHIEYNLLNFLSLPVKNEAHQLFEFFRYWRECICGNFTKISIPRQMISGQTWVTGHHLEMCPGSSKTSPVFGISNTWDLKLQIPGANLITVVSLSENNQSQSKT